MNAVLLLLLLAAPLLPPPVSPPRPAVRAGDFRATPPAAAVPKPAAGPIAWSAARPLTVADFQSRPSPGERLAALTSTNIKAGAACRDFVFSGTVEATFDPATSWVRSPATLTSALLRHEQMHFDLTEVYARRLRQRLVVFQARANCEKLQPAFNNVTKPLYSEWDREQNRYDQETNHGLNTDRQAAWEQQTQARLEQLKAFAQ